MARILIAETNQALKHHLTSQLMRAGHSIMTVDNSLEAWRLLQVARFDVLMVNVMLPGIDGFTLSQKAIEPNPEMKVIFITGFSGVALDYFKTDFGISHVTSRPFHLTRVAAKIRYLLGQGDDAGFMSPLPMAADNVIYADFRR